MITRADFVTRCLERGNVAEAFDHLVDRARTAAGVPEKSVDPWRDMKECLNRAIGELCAARNEM